MPTSDDTTVSDDEIAHFDQLAATWWDPKGPMRPLHEMNPLRTGWIAQHLQAKKTVDSPPSTVLDIGCGAGLASEAFARLGYHVLGLDASSAGIKAAEAHLREFPLPASAGSLRYRHGASEQLVEEGATFDVVVALEVIEHTTDPKMFLNHLAKLTKPGGLLGLSTLNRTFRSLAVAKIGAEYVARLLPIGTHSWKKFIRPHELEHMAREAGFRMIDVAGMSFRPMHWRITKDTSINYIAMFQRSA